jgi:glycosyltransferase involved in cell wall biosynthesis
VRILITNNTLAGRAGSEVYVRDLALALLRRGHDPVVYSNVLGEVAEELRRATVPVIDDLSALNSPPDLIHGQHHLDAMVAVLRFPQVPAIYMCHGWAPWQERPPVYPSIRRYVAVDDLCRERLLTTPGIAADRVDVLLNGVDLARFQARPPLPARARSALVFSNYAAPGGYGDTIVRACRAHGLERVEIVGGCSGRSTAEPERLLQEFDIVFAKARSAIEAMAVGCAVVVADTSGLAGMVDSNNVQRLRRFNFGVRTMQAQRVSEASVAAALARYDAHDAGRVSAFIRADADFDAGIDRLLDIYGQAMAEGPLPAPADAGHAAASAYLASLSVMLKEREVAQARADAAEQQLAQQQLEAEEQLLHSRAEGTQAIEALGARHAAQLQEITARSQEQVSQVSALRQALEAAQAQQDALRTAVAEAQPQVEALAEIHRSRAWRAVSGYRRFRKWLS